MREAVIVSTARTGLAKAGRGGFNMTHGAKMGGHVIKHAIERAGIEAGAVEDVLMGCAIPEGATGHNIGRRCHERGLSCHGLWLYCEPSMFILDCKPLQWHQAAW